MGLEEPIRGKDGEELYAARGILNGLGLSMIAWLAVGGMFAITYFWL